ncbi:transglutaminase family protein [bacterium]|nr:transglutaminase family protein [bacterium]
MWLQTRCNLAFDIAVPTPFILMLRPRSGANQWVASEEYKLSPSVPAFEFTDGYGNLCQRLVAPPGAFSIRTSARVMTADQLDRAPGAPLVAVQDLPNAVLSFLLPSRYCESEQFGSMAAEITVGNVLGYDQVSAIETWLRSNISFEPGSSAVAVTATDVNARGYGVCRDLAHLGIALCRALCIPARMVVGYLHGLQPMTLHAWFEAYVDGRWYAFDPTQPVLGGGYVTIGYGRDAADVAIFSQFGQPVTQTLEDVQVTQLADADA